jgi:hypothetical protein
VLRIIGILLLQPCRGCAEVCVAHTPLVAPFFRQRSRNQEDVSCIVRLKRSVLHSIDEDLLVAIAAVLLADGWHECGAGWAVLQATYMKQNSLRTAVTGVTPFWRSQICNVPHQPTHVCMHPVAHSLHVCGVSVVPPVLAGLSCILTAAAADLY